MKSYLIQAAIALAIVAGGVALIFRVPALKKLVIGA